MYKMVKASLIIWRLDQVFKWSATLFKTIQNWTGFQMVC
jgi:hypothetical protein